MKNNYTLPYVDILITDFCNLNCPFCFAREEMKSPLKKEMSIKDFKLIVKKCRESGILAVSLIGGEPTLHSRFEEIMRIALIYLVHIYIATNGIYSNQVERMFLKQSSRFSFFFNVSTPAFAFNKKLRKMILERIRRLSLKTRVVLVVISKFINAKEAINIISLIDKKLLKNVAVRLVVEGTVAGNKNYTTIENFPKIGNNLFKVYKYLEKLSPKSIEILKSSVVPCMFSPNQRNYLKQRSHLKNFFCHPKSDQAYFLVTPALVTFKCYPLSTIDRIQITKDTNFKKLREYYQTLQDKYHKEYVFPRCRSCPFFGLEENKCPGPCLGFKINALKTYQNPNNIVSLLDF